MTLVFVHHWFQDDPQLKQLKGNGESRQSFETVISLGLHLLEYFLCLHAQITHGSESGWWCWQWWLMALVVAMIAGGDNWWWWRTSGDDDSWACLAVKSGLLEFCSKTHVSVIRYLRDYSLFKKVPDFLAWALSTNFLCVCISFSHPLNNVSSRTGLAVPHGSMQIRSMMTSSQSPHNLWQVTIELLVISPIWKLLGAQTPCVSIYPVGLTYCYKEQVCSHQECFSERANAGKNWRAQGSL